MTRTTNIKALVCAALAVFGLSVITFMPGKAEAAGSYIRPVIGATVLRFGAGYTDAAGRSRKHHGIDINAAVGASVAAPAPGKVVFAGSTPNGKCVSIIHSGGVKTTYLPLDSIRVSKGDNVQTGAIIGFIGPSSDPSGSFPHLHMGAILAGEYFDPESLFRGEFRTDLSKLIRRGNIPPGGSESKYLPPAATVAVGIPGFIGWIWDKVSLFFEWLGGGARVVWSVLTNSATYVWRKISGFTGKVFAKFRGIFFPPAFGSWMGWLIPGLDTISGFATSEGPRVFDPSGDASAPENRISIVPQSLPARIEIFDSAGKSVWVLNSWEISGEEILWTGLDGDGRIVPNGQYTVIIEYSDCVEGFIAEAKWHM